MPNQNTFFVTDLEKIGASIVYDKCIKSTWKGTLYTGVLYLREQMYNVEIFIFRFGGAQIQNIIAPTVEESIKKTAIIEDILEQEITNRKKHVGVKIIKRTLLRWLARIVIFISFYRVFVWTFQKDPKNYKAIAIYLVIFIIACFIRFVSNRF